MSKQNNPNVTLVVALNDVIKSVPSFSTRGFDFTIQNRVDLPYDLKNTISVGSNDTGVFMRYGSSAIKFRDSDELKNAFLNLYKLVLSSDLLTEGDIKAFMFTDVKNVVNIVNKAELAQYYTDNGFNLNLLNEEDSRLFVSENSVFDTNCQQIINDYNMSQTTKQEEASAIQSSIIGDIFENRTPVYNQNVTPSPEPSLPTKSLGQMLADKDERDNNEDKLPESLCKMFDAIMALQFTYNEFEKIPSTNNLELLEKMASFIKRGDAINDELESNPNANLNQSINELTDLIINFTTEMEDHIKNTREKFVPNFTAEEIIDMAREKGAEYAEEQLQRLSEEDRNEILTKVEKLLS